MASLPSLSFLGGRRIAARSSNRTPAEYAARFTPEDGLPHGRSSDPDRHYSGGKVTMWDLGLEPAAAPPKAGRTGSGEAGSAAQQPHRLVSPGATARAIQVTGVVHQARHQIEDTVDAVSPERGCQAGVHRAPTQVRFPPMTDRSAYPTRKRRLQDPEDSSEVDDLSPAARLAMVWPLTLQAWAFHTGQCDEPRLRRDVVRVARRGR